MARHTLIDTYLAELSRWLPADAVDELADGLLETYRHHLDAGLDESAAATAAVAEFGTPEQVTAAFTRHAPGRRTAMALLATGPVVGVCWAATLVTARAWTWPVPIPVTIAVGGALLGAVALLAGAASSRRSASRARLAAAGGSVVILLDVVALAAVALAAPPMVWPLVVAIPASFARLVFTARSLPQVLMR